MSRAVVVAHPDDEALWLSSVVASAARVVFGFGAVPSRAERGAARRRAIAALPPEGSVNLAFPESGAGWKAYQEQAEPTGSGLRITDAPARARYEANFVRLIDGLRPVLTGCSAVYTHNPWGEYGHSEHVQVYRAVATLQAELGYTLWFSNYVSAGNLRAARRLAETHGWDERVVVRPDVATARRLMRIYRRHGASTYTILHRWPAEEVLYSQAPGAGTAARRPFTNEWLLDVTRLRWWPVPWRDARCQLPDSSSMR